MLKRSAQHRFVAWLALAAMALIVLMPVISRAMPMDMAMGDMAPSTIDAGCALHGAHADHHHQHGMPEHPDDPTAHCGYCVLFSHMPVVGFDTPLILPPVHLASATPHTALPFNVPAAPPLSAQPRGPPLIING
ncbi:DUF2946 domain-containing protein [Dyella sp.]|uniref:DUF2946 domain-containing protein n=1 Tax=Dyella sp. TaxID=1869338 RepID=UPI002B45FC19|nr:DUF2946 domain-containing protein [Dyella sp.]HKT30237.1 DUF2946 domain-containing protein [Dyella sp.]